MRITLNIPLFYKPAHELGQEGQPITESAPFRRLGDSHQIWLHRVADLVDKLLATGWVIHMGLYDLFCDHPDVTTEMEATTQLGALGIDPDEVGIEDSGEDLDEEGNE